MNFDQILKSIREEDPGQAVVDAAAEEARHVMHKHGEAFCGREGGLHSTHIIRMLIIGKLARLSHPAGHH